MSSSASIRRRKRRQPRPVMFGHSPYPGIPYPPPVLVLGTNNFFLMVKRCVDIGGGFAVAATARLDHHTEALESVGVIGAVLIHVPPEKPGLATEAAFEIRAALPRCGIVLVGGPTPNPVLSLEDDQGPAWVHVPDGALLRPAALVKAINRAMASMIAQAA